MSLLTYTRPPQKCHLPLSLHFARLGRYRSQNCGCDCQMVARNHGRTSLYGRPPRFLSEDYIAKRAIGFRLGRLNSLQRVTCQAWRRHHRRRDVDLRPGNSKTVFGKEKSASEKGRYGTVEDERVVIMIDLEDVKEKAAGAAERARHAMETASQRIVSLGKTFGKDGSEFWRDLRSSVALQNDTRVVISVRRSSIEFAANAILCCLLLFAVWKIFVKAAKRYRWGWEEAFDGQGIVRRDRSLAGKEVLVSRGEGKAREVISSRNVSREVRKVVSPLDGVEVSRSEKEMARQRGDEMLSAGRTAGRLPGWWPDTKPVSAVSKQEEENAQAEASALLQAITDKRLSGRDFTEEDILQLRRICKYTGAKVRFDTLNVRDSLYRAAIDLVLSSCGRISMKPTSAEFAGEKPSEFLAGLASNMNIEAERAATLVNAAVAARTKAIFLQAWALHMQGKDLEAEEQLVKLLHMHLIFPPEHNSPEMEMVAQGLGRQLSLAERKNLLQMYLKMGGSQQQRTASEALGLVSTRGRP